MNPSDLSHSAGRVGRLIFPVFVAGLVHVATLKLNLLRALAIPIDRGAEWRGRPLLGSNKTWRGVLLMTALTGGFAQLQAFMSRSEDGQSIACRTSPWIAGGLVGLSYCLAELPNSFVKRRLGIAPGSRSTRAAPAQYILDQIDSAVGCTLAMRFLYRTRRAEIALAFVLGTALHAGVDVVLYVIGVKGNEWRIAQTSKRRTFLLF